LKKPGQPPNTITVDLEQGRRRRQRDAEASDTKAPRAAQMAGRRPDGQPAMMNTGTAQLMTPHGRRRCSVNVRKRV
jgi:hypothetical protein